MLAPKIASIAKSEFETFGDFTEADHPMKARLNDYGHVLNLAEDYFEMTPWGLPFVYFCVYEAGVSHEDFPFRGTAATLAHWSVLQQDKPGAAFVGADPKKAVCAPGDLFVFDRQDASLSYDDIVRSDNFAASIGIVAEIDETHVHAVRGNLNDKIGVISFRHTEGRLDPAGSESIICVIKTNI